MFSSPFHRYKAVASAAKGKRVTERQAAFLLAVVITWAAVVALLPILGWNSYQWFHGESVCKFSLHTEQSFPLLLSVTCFVLPFVVMLSCYAGVFIRLRRHARTMKSWQDASDTTAIVGQRMRREGRTTYFVVAILGVFILCWVPFFVLTMLQMSPRLSVPMPLRMLASWSTSANAMFNPFIYIIMNSRFRNELITMCPCLTPLRSRRIGDASPAFQRRPSAMETEQ